jgi:hypothetical protein
LILLLLLLYLNFLLHQLPITYFAAAQTESSHASTQYSRCLFESRDETVVLYLRETCSIYLQCSFSCSYHPWSGWWVLQLNLVCIGIKHHSLSLHREKWMAAPFYLFLWPRDWFFFTTMLSLMEKTGGNLGLQCSQTHRWIFFLSTPHEYKVGLNEY